MKNSISNPIKSTLLEPRSISFSRLLLRSYIFTPEKMQNPVKICLNKRETILKSLASFLVKHSPTPLGISMFNDFKPSYEKSTTPLLSPTDPKRTQRLLLNEKFISEFQTYVIPKLLKSYPQIKKVIHNFLENILKNLYLLSTKSVKLSTFFVPNKPNHLLLYYINIFNYK